MKVRIFICVFVLGIFNVEGQISNVTEEFALPASLNESSGAIYFNNKLITHNDSGGNNELYEVDLVSGLVTRTVTISNATNVDWEDITQDDTSIYIADIGNNNGNRTDLKIYKIDKTAYASTTNVTAEIIAISYTDQTDFTSNFNNNEWDAEALVSFDGTNLILFNKNWVSGITKAYLVPKTSGTHPLSPLATTLDSGGLITGGTFNPFTGKLYLIGYNGTLQPFVWDCELFSGNDVFSGTNTKTALSSLFLEQTEAITFKDANSYYVTSESFNQGGFSDYAKLISFTTNDGTLSVQNNQNPNKISLYPNPVKNLLYIDSDEVDSVEIFDMKSMKLYAGNEQSINMSGFTKGIYIVKINLAQNRSLIKKIVKQ